MHKRLNRFIPWLVFFSIGLRSLVAPGYMFSGVDAEGKFTLGLTWCAGLNNINATENTQSHHHGNNGAPDENTNSEHFTAACGVLAGSTNFIVSTFAPNAAYSTPDTMLLQIYQDSVSGLSIYRKSHPPRAPSRTTSSHV